MHPSIALLTALMLLAQTPAAEPEPRVVGLLRDFDKDKAGPLAPIKFHNWTAEQQRDAGKFSQVEILPDGGKQSCKLTIHDTFPWGNLSSYRALTIGPDYLPPQADAVRLRVKVLEGSFRLAVGSPTVYFGHSDVLSETHDVKAADKPGWQTLVFSLNHKLTRNLRRARFGQKSPVIHYTRWIQEPLYLNVARPSRGVMLLDQVELISQGEGRAFPEMAAERIKQVAAIADFEQPADPASAFTFFQDPIDLEKEPHSAREGWLPPSLRRVEHGRAGKFSLLIEQKGTEEVAFAGIKATGRAQANAISLSIQGSHPTSGQHVVIDFIVYVTLPSRRDHFPWQDFEPPASWKKDARAFTYYLDQPRTRGASYGFYHLRRTVPNGAWTTLVLPFPDFICAYGQRDCEPMFRQQLPLQGETIMALGLLSPYGQRSATTRLLIDDLAFVHVPGTAEELRSYWQNKPD